MPALAYGCAHSDLDDGGDVEFGKTEIVRVGWEEEEREGLAS